jgi:hypothetical protein
LNLTLQKPTSAQFREFRVSLVVVFNRLVIFKYDYIYCRDWVAFAVDHSRSPPKKPPSQPNTFQFSILSAQYDICSSHSSDIISEALPSNKQALQLTLAAKLLSEVSWIGSTYLIKSNG